MRMKFVYFTAFILYDCSEFLFGLVFILIVPIGAITAIYYLDTYFKKITLETILQIITILAFLGGITAIFFSASSGTGQKAVKKIYFACGEKLLFSTLLIGLGSLSYLISPYINYIPSFLLIFVRIIGFVFSAIGMYSLSYPMMDYYLKLVLPRLLLRMQIEKKEFLKQHL